MPAQHILIFPDIYQRSKMPVNSKTLESIFMIVLTSDKELCQRTHSTLRTLGVMAGLCGLAIEQQTTIERKVVTTYEWKHYASQGK